MLKAKLVKREALLVTARDPRCVCYYLSEKRNPILLTLSKMYSYLADRIYTVA